MEQLPNDRLDWRDVSSMADHLKQGVFVQRHRGNFARQLSVPLGTFAVTNHRNIWAPVGSYFAPESLEDSENNRMCRVTNHHSPLSYAFIREHFDYTSFLAEQVEVTTESS